jgi:hypothetical protein
VTVRRAAWLAGAALLAVYVATLAPSVTFWDAGEFIAAARVLGIPHPPGTPLFVIALNAWARLLWFLPFATATNLLSAVCTAAAGGLAALWIGRSSRSVLAGVAAAITAGAMSSVWQNATETEVYSASLLLSLAAIVAADRAGTTGERRWIVLAAYLLALAVPLHLSALVAAPVVILLATDRVTARRDWSAGCLLLGLCLALVGVSRASMLIVAVGVAVAAASVLLDRHERRTALVARAASVVAVGLIACGALLFLLLRARHDPLINQGDPNTWRRVAYVVAREQYDVAAPWPRQAPIWLQLANWFEYADWQVALSLGPTVFPTIARVLATVCFATLGLVGAGWHRRADRRTWRAVMLLFFCGSLGVIGYVNFKAGRSFGWQFVPQDARHEARDRDYFFALGFWAWGMWAGMGAIALARRFALPLVLGLVVAALPIALNWSTVSRRGEPEASLPREVAALLLDPLPPRAVLFVAGDNDSYPLWYAQQVEGRRRDVTVVTMPLLAAPWYVEELGRRHQLIATLPVGDINVIAGAVANAARARGRPVAVALTVPPDDRSHLSGSWRVAGLVAIDETPASIGVPVAGGPASMAVDTVATRTVETAIDAWRRGRVARPSVDQTNEYFMNVLSCPGLIVAPNPSKVQLTSRDSICNLPDRK